MAIGIDYNVKQDLIDAVVAKVFQNSNFAITGEGLQSSLCDMIESLWRDETGGSGSSTNIVNTTYADLLALVNAGTLSPGTFYRFTYENIHDIVNSSLANTQVPGYTSITETLYVFASSATKLSGFALSEEHKYDIIEYDVTQSLHGSPGIYDNGNIIRRYDVKNDNEAYFDFRNHTVARFAFKNPLTTNITTLNRSVIGNYIDSGGINQTVISLRSGSPVDDTNLNGAIGHLFEDQPYYPFNNGSIELFDLNNIVVETPITYYSSFFTDDVTHIHTGIRLGKGVKDILITNGGNYSPSNKKACSDIRIENHACGCTISNSSDVTIGKHSMVVLVRNSNDVSIGDSCDRVLCIDSQINKIEKKCSSVVILQGENNKVDNSSSDVLIKTSNFNELGVKNEKILIIRNSHKNVFGNNCGGISLGNTTANDFRSSCNDIDIFSGGYNRFAQGCNTINLVGEKDPAYNGGTYYSMYSQMSNNTFGMNCENISFRGMNGLRGCTFGDECKTLEFGKHSDPTYNPSGYIDGGTVNGPALMNTSFCRGIQNKTFYDYPLVGFSMITPNTTPASIYHYRWYAQSIILNENRSNRNDEETNAFYIEVEDHTIGFVKTYSLAKKRVNSVTNWEQHLTTNTPDSYSYTSTATDTKVDITAAFLALLNLENPGGNHYLQGEGILLSPIDGAGNRYYISESDNLIVMDSDIKGRDVGPEIYNAGNWNQPLSNKISVTYESDGGGTGGELGGAGFKTIHGVKGTPIAGGDIRAAGTVSSATSNPTDRSRGYGIHGYPGGGAFVWTERGYPLAVMMTKHLNSGSDTLNRPFSIYGASAGDGYNSNPNNPDPNNSSVTMP